MSCEAGSLTSILNRMEEKNLIKRKTLNGNRRSYHIFLPIRKESIKIISDEFKKIEEQAFDGIAEADREAFMKMFTQIYNNLKRKEEKNIE